MTLADWRRRIEPADVLILFYVAAIVRQYFWIIPSNRWAWLLTIVSTVCLWLVYLRFKGSDGDRVPYAFWLIVGLPLLLVYLLRLSFPDISFDVLNYRLIQSERSLRGPLFVPGDFFPTIFPLNPAPDTLTGLFRHFLGYRLGTIINLFALVWTALILNKFLRSSVTRATLRSVLVLVVLFTEQSLFQVNTYMVDLLAVPLILEATWLTINYQETARKHRDAILIALLLGIATAMKLSNATSVIPVGILFVFEFFKARQLRKPVLAASLPVLFLLPILPHAFYIYRLTGSPVFPLYNKIFKSIYWAEINVGDGRWGAEGWLATIAWPLTSIIHPERLSELGVYSGRLTISVVAALVCFLLPFIPGSMRKLAFLFLAGSLLWSISSGYVRYALFLEMIGGVIFVLLLVRLYESFSTARPAYRRAIVGLFAGVLLAQCLVASFFSYRTSWGIRQTVIDTTDVYFSELRFLMHDHTLTKFLSEDAKASIANVDTWIVSDVKTGGIEILLRPETPMLGLHNQEYFTNPISRAKFAEALAENRGRRMYSLSLNEDLDFAFKNIRSRGLAVGSVKGIQIPFFSEYKQIPMTLIEVAASNAALKKKEGPDVATQATGPLPDDAYQAEVTVNAPPTILPPAHSEIISVTIRNTSGQVWQVKGQEDGRYYLNVGNAWLDEGQNLINNLDGRANLPYDIWPNESVTIPLKIKTPAMPGNYILEIDLVQEGVAWFKGRGSTTLQIPVKVE